MLASIILVAAAAITSEPPLAQGPGLSQEQISQTIYDSSDSLMSCVDSGARVSDRLQFQLVVSPSGQVTGLEVLRSGGVAPETVACVGATLQEIRFPDHDAGDDFTFVYPPAE